MLKLSGSLLQETALLSSFHDILQLLEPGANVSLVFFNLRKAFDSVLHLPLLQKLSDCGLNQHILQWITCYLSDREQYVVSGNLCVQVLIYRGSKGKDIEFQSDQDFDIGVKNFLCSKSMNALRYDET